MQFSYLYRVRKQVDIYSANFVRGLLVVKVSVAIKEAPDVGKDRYRALSCDTNIAAVPIL